MGVSTHPASSPSGAGLDCLPDFFPIPSPCTRRPHRPGDRACTTGTSPRTGARTSRPSHAPFGVQPDRAVERHDRHLLDLLGERRDDEPLLTRRARVSMSPPVTRPAQQDHVLEPMTPGPATLPVVDLAPCSPTPQALPSLTLVDRQPPGGRDRVPPAHVLPLLVLVLPRSPGTDVDLILIARGVPWTEILRVRQPPARERGSVHQHLGLTAGCIAREPRPRQAHQATRAPFTASRSAAK